MTKNLKAVPPMYLYLALTVLALAVLFLLSDASAFGVAEKVNTNGTKACAEAKAIASGPWPKAFAFGGGALAIWGIFRKERDGFQNLIWVAAFAAIFAGLAGVLSAFGISCA